MKPAQLWSLPVVCLIGAATLAQPSGLGEEKSSSSLGTPAAEADKAWDDLRAAKRAYSELVDSIQASPAGRQTTPVDPRTLMERVKELTGAIGDKAGAFLEKFPDDERASEAREVAVKMWSYLAMMKDSVRAKRYSDLLDACLADRSLPEEERAQMYLRKIQLKDPGYDPKTAMGHLRALKEKFSNSRFYYCQVGIHLTQPTPMGSVGWHGRGLPANLAGVGAAVFD